MCETWSLFSYETVKKIESATDFFVFSIVRLYVEVRYRLTLMDEYLIRSAQNGNKEALDKLIRRYYDSIYRYCLHHVGDKHVAEDLCQETFVSMIKQIDNYRHFDKFQNFLYVIAGNKCKDFYKKKKPLYLEDVPEQVQETNGKEEQILIQELVHVLPKELQEVVILRFYQELKYRDIADILQITVSGAKYRVKRAVEMLRIEMEERSEI